MAYLVKIFDKNDTTGRAKVTLESMLLPKDLGHLELAIVNLNPAHLRSLSSFEGYEVLGEGALHKLIVAAYVAQTPFGSIKLDGSEFSGELICNCAESTSDLRLENFESSHIRSLVFGPRSWQRLPDLRALKVLELKCNNHNKYGLLHTLVEGLPRMPSLHKLILAGIPLSFPTLQRAMTITKAHTVLLPGCRLSDLSEAQLDTEKNESVKWLSWEPPSSMALATRAKYVQPLVKLFGKLEILQLSGCHMKTVEALDPILKSEAPTIRKLGLSNNTISMLGMFKFFGSIQEMKSLESLDLSDNPFEDLVMGEASGDWNDYFHDAVRRSPRLGLLHISSAFKNAYLKEETNAILRNRCKDNCARYGLRMLRLVEGTDKAAWSKVLSTLTPTQTFCLLNGCNDIINPAIHAGFTDCAGSQENRKRQRVNQRVTAEPKPKRHNSPKEPVHMDTNNPQVI